MRITTTTRNHFEEAAAAAVCMQKANGMPSQCMHGCANEHLVWHTDMVYEHGNRCAQFGKRENTVWWQARALRCCAFACIVNRNISCLIYWSTIIGEHFRLIDQENCSLVYRHPTLVHPFIFFSSAQSSSDEQHTKSTRSKCACSILVLRCARMYVCIYQIGKLNLHILLWYLATAFQNIRIQVAREMSDEIKPSGENTNTHNMRVKTSKYQKFVMMME